MQDRDLRLLRELSVMRIIDREQAKLAAQFGSTTRANVRLLALTRAGLLRRFFLGTVAGGKKALYALSARGATLVQVPLRGPRRRSNEMLSVDFFVQHQLAINELYCAVKFRPIPLPHATFARWESFSAPLEQGISLIPDGYCEVANAGITLASFLEVDLGHEGRRIWKTKIQNYLRYAVSGHFEKQFHVPRFRVLVVTNTERRLQSIRSLTSTLTEKIFWFASFEAINRDGIWSPVWLRPTDDRRLSLL
jgi:hypothetical protein